MSIITLTLLAGCTSIAMEDRDPQDPLEGFNRGMYRFNDALDTAVIKPLAQGYQAVMPDPADRAVTNFFSNLMDVVVTLNELLQGKPVNAAESLSRLVFNTTFGLGGLFDVATRMGLPKREEDFGQTLGVWGVGPGPYLVLPVLGPRTVRDTVGLLGDWFAHPVRQMESSTAQWALFTVDVIDKRSDLLRAERVFDAAALDPYLFLRTSYLQRRRFLVYDGDPPLEPLDPDQ